jgi:predicted RND superfamily exporter protein
MSLDENSGQLESMLLRGWRSLCRRRHDLALGIERIGLISLRFPTIVGVLAIALGIAAGFGVARIKIDDSLSQLFRSDTPEYKLYAQETRLFPSSEFDVLIVIDGKTLLERSSIGKLRNLVTDLQLIDGARGIISMFSARQPPENGRLPAPLVPDDLPRGDAYQQLVHRITSNEIIRGKLLSNDGKLTLIVLALDPDAVQSDRLSSIVQDVHKTVDADWPEPISTQVSPAFPLCNSRSAMPSSATG